MRLTKYVLMVLFGIGSFLAGAMLQGLHLSTFIQPVAFCSVMGLFVVFVLVRYTPAECYRMFCLALGKEVANDREYQKVQKKLTSLGTMAMTSGLIIGLVGTLQALFMASDSTRLGSGVAIAFTGVFYGFSLQAFLCLPLEFGIMDHRLWLKGKEENTFTHSMSSLLWFVFAITGIFLVFSAITSVQGVPLFRDVIANSVLFISGPIAAFACLTGFKLSPDRLFAVRRSALSSCVMAVIVGAIHMMGSLSSWILIVTGVGVALSPIIYWIVFSIVCGLVAERWGQASKKRLQPMRVSMKREGMFAVSGIFVLGFLFSATLLVLSHEADKAFQKTSSEVMCEMPTREVSQVRESFCEKQRLQSSN